MITILGYDGTATTILSPEEVTAWLVRAGARVWVNLMNPTTTETEQLHQAFALPFFTREEGSIAAAYLHTTPRFIIGHIPLEYHPPLTFYLGKQFIITICKETLAPLNDLWLTYQQDLSRWPYGLDYLLYQLCHEYMTLPREAAANIHETLSTTIQTSDIPLPHHTHQLSTWQYYLHQWHQLTQHLATEKHELLDANTQYQFQILSERIQTEADKVTLWQGWLITKQQKLQAQQVQHTQQLLNRLFWVGILLCVLMLLTLIVNGF